APSKTGTGVFSGKTGLREVRVGPPADLSKRCGDLGAAFGVAAVDEHLRAEPREILGDATADPGGRAGHDADLACERMGGHQAVSVLGLFSGVCVFGAAPGSSTDLITSPSCIASNARRQPSRPVFSPPMRSGRVRPEPSRWITRSHTG